MRRHRGGHRDQAIPRHTAVVSTLLHRDPIYGGGAHLLRLPAWVPPKAAGLYWHQPRSGSLRSDGRVHIRYWCGQTRNSHVDALSTLTDSPAPELRCGTCIGRHMGYVGESGAVFRPHDQFAPPKRCPGGVDENQRCLSCGERLRWYAWNASGPSRHSPFVPTLLERIAPCPQHGWRSMRPYGDYRRDVMVACTVFQCEHVGGPR